MISNAQNTLIPCEDCMLKDPNIKGKDYLFTIIESPSIVKSINVINIKQKQKGWKLLYSLKKVIKIFKEQLMGQEEDLKEHEIEVVIRDKRDQRIIENSVQSEKYQFQLVNLLQGNKGKKSFDIYIDGSLEKIILK